MLSRKTTKSIESSALGKIRQANRRRSLAEDLANSVKIGIRTKGDLFRVGHNEKELADALEMGLILHDDDGIYVYVPKWARIDPKADLPQKADFTSLADPASGTPPLIGQVGADALIEPEGLDVQPAQVRSDPIKPHHVHERRKEEGCRLCAAGVEHISYLGVSRRTGYRLWTGSAGLIDLAKRYANSKGLFARARPNGSNGFALLTVEDDRRLDGIDPFADMELEELIGV